MLFLFFLFIFRILFYIDLLRSRTYYNNSIIMKLSDETIDKGCLSVVVVLNPTLSSPLLKDLIEVKYGQGKRKLCWNKRVRHVLEQPKIMELTRWMLSNITIDLSGDGSLFDTLLSSYLGYCKVTTTTCIKMLNYLPSGLSLDQSCCDVQYGTTKYIVIDDSKKWILLQTFHWITVFHSKGRSK